jgi:2-methylcitrate dehydratase
MSDSGSYTGKQTNERPVAVARRIAEYATRLNYESLPPEVVKQVKRTVLDLLGCAIGGYQSETSRIVLQFIEEIGGTPESTVIGSGLRTSCLNAVLANGAMARYLDFNDTHLVPIGDKIQGGHPCELIPTVLALGERQHSPGREVITSIVLGYEVNARFCEGLEIPLENLGWNSDARGPYLMPVVAGKVLGLNAEQMTNAIGISGSHNMVLRILDAPGEASTMTKNLRFPRTAYGGVMAALLAQKGFTGPVRVIEGNRGFIQAVMGGAYDANKLNQGGEHFKIMDVQFKSIISESTMQGHLTATLSLITEHDIRPEDVAQIRIWAGARDVEHTGDDAKRYPKNKESADHSSYYCTGRIVLDRMLGPGQYTPEKLQDPRVRELSDKIIFQADHDLDQYGDAGISEITTKQGNIYKRRVDYPKGHPRNPMTDEELERKFCAMASEYMT